MPWTTEQKIFIVEAYFRQKSIHWFSDEAHFLFSGYVNSKNNIFWGSTPPEHCLQRPLHSVKCSAWVVISKHGIVGPFWFEDDNERSVTINTERYVQVLDKFWTALGRRRGIVRVLQWFQQDGATAHTLNESLAWLQQRFPDRLISRRCDLQWSPHSPDLNPPDFYLWGYLKCMATTPDYPWPEGSNKSNPKGGSSRNLPARSKCTCNARELIWSTFFECQCNKEFL